MVRGFASNVCGFILKVDQKRLLRCVIGAGDFLVCHHQRNPQAFCQEAVTWKRLTHPNILSLLGITIVPLQLISNWMSNGDLLEYLKGHSDADRLGLVCTHSVAFIPCLLPYQLSDVARGLCYLHSCNVIHGDLKGVRGYSKSCFSTVLTLSQPNVLVDDFGHAHIADFGFATVTQNLDSVPSASGHHGYTVRWAAPEVLNDGTYSKEADIFSFAMVMIEVSHR
jgi:serine/threonine protein kinase